MQRKLTCKHLVCKKIIRISDGLHQVHGFCPFEVHDYDIINMLEYEVTEIKTEKILMIKNMKLVYTGLKNKIGLPVDYSKENSNENNISALIPAFAQLVIVEEEVFLFMSLFIF